MGTIISFLKEWGARHGTHRCSRFLVSRLPTVKNPVHPENPVNPVRLEDRTNHEEWLDLSAVVPSLCCLWVYTLNPGNNKV
ncbi:MAG: hypothetical protein LGR52_10600, partial [Candidatus Thiosymbion ectosymbiont of Robbea hypermnestra]|nr:hypothetical protein [Candidatus Thiosymbion ectosymbiont of Robbea hypermnestra]